MGISDVRLLQKEGAVLVNGADGAITGATGFSDGGCISAVTRTGAGTYTVTLSPAQSKLQNIIVANVLGGAGNANVQVAASSDTSLAVTTFVGAVATDETFYLTVIRVKQGS